MIATMQKLFTKKQLGLLMALPMVAMLSSCGGTVSLEGKDASLAQKTLTQGKPEALYPDDKPSVPDGKLVWEQQNCASCHGATGSGGSAPVDLSDKKWMREQKPVDQYMFLTYGKEGTQHPALHDTLSRRQIWNLVFFTRALAVPPMSQEEWMAVDSVFGANCAVCHGKKGYGDGPLAHNLEPVPANFQQYNRFYDRTDQILWEHIAYGIKWEGMPNFLGKTQKVGEPQKFDQDYIWKLVSYVRAFHETGTATVAQAAPEKKDDDANKKNPIR